jgi:hypothetical protein
MIKKIHLHILFLISIIPFWAIKVKFELLENLFLFFFLTTLFLLNFFLLYFYKSKKINNFLLIYLGVIFTWGIDNHLGLYNGVIVPEKEFFIKIFGNIYFAALSSLIVIFLIISAIIKKLRENGVIILSFFLISISLFNLFDNSKNSSGLYFFDQSKNLKLKNKTTLIFILDEMSGLNSFESKTSEGIEFDKIVKDFSKKYEFNIYSNIYTSSYTSIISIPAILNKDYSKKNRLNFAVHSKKFFTENNIIKNQTFDFFNSISVFQNMHINYCDNNNVKKCDQYNPFYKNEFICCFKDTVLTKLISSWRLYGSSVSALTWRVLMHFRIIDNVGSPNGDKASFNFLLKKIKKDIKSKRFDLIFSHSLMPHKPYGFDKNCSYDGALALGNFGLNMPIEKHTLRHNIDRTCTIRFLDIFLQELKNDNVLKDLEIFILSDHGSRNQIENPESSLKSFFIYKNNKTKFKEIVKRKNSQTEFHRLLYKKN